MNTSSLQTYRFGFFLNKFSFTISLYLVEVGSHQTVAFQEGHQNNKVYHIHAL